MNLLPRLIPVEFEKAQHPSRVGLLRAETVVLHSQHLPDLIHQRRFGIGNHERSLSRIASAGIHGGNYHTYRRIAKNSPR